MFFGRLEDQRRRGTAPATESQGNFSSRFVELADFINDLSSDQLELLVMGDEILPSYIPGLFQKPFFKDPAKLSQSGFSWFMSWWQGRRLV